MNSKTAEAILRDKIKEHSDSTVVINVDDVPVFTHFLFVAIDAVQEYASQQTEALTDQIKDLERENSEYRAVYDSVVKSRDELRQENERLRKLFSDLVGLEAWIDDRQMKELFTNVLRKALK